MASFETDPISIRLLPEAFCRKNGVVVLGTVDLERDDPVLLGLLEPDNEPLLRDIRLRLERPLRTARVNRLQLERYLKLGYHEPMEPEGHLISNERAEPGPESEAPELLDDLILRAVADGASDIHIESYPGEVVVRMRRDGIMRPVFSYVGPDNVAELVSRLKVLSELDISEKRKPQDGRFRATILRATGAHSGGSAIIDFRVSVIPGPQGEEAVIRVLDPRVGLVPLADLGMTVEMQTTLLHLLMNPEGMILVTGPTGSGKTSTLYAALRQLSSGARKVVTAEDPIEYLLDGIAQKESGPAMSMYQLLRALLRHDPDVMLFGEIRDHDTAEIANDAAGTGHLVLGTLHTSDAVGAVERLRALDLVDTEIAGHLLAVVTQRLVRKVCTHCTRETIPSARQSKILGALLDSRTFVEGAGCERCRDTGYSGRTGIFELLLVDSGLQDLIGAGRHRAELRQYARERGFRSLVEHALEKVDAGITTLDELTRVVPYRQLLAAAAEAAEA